MKLEELRLTLGQAAAVMAKAESDRYSEAYLARQLRHLVQNGGIKPSGYRGEGRTAAAVLDFGELLAASIQTYLLRAGFATEHIHTVRRLMNNVDKGAELNPPIDQSAEDCTEWEQAPWSLESVALRIAANHANCPPERYHPEEQWFLNLHLPRYFGPATAEEEEEEAEEDVKPIRFMGSWSTTPEHGFPQSRILCVATLVIQANNFVRSLLRALSDEARLPAE